jgi:hypothetical protein
MFDPTDASIWVHYADQSYLATRLLWFTAFHLDVPVHAHRTMELYLKAYAVSYGRQIARNDIWGHDLGVLYDKCISASPSFASREVERRSRFLNRYFEHVRYPSEPGSPEDGSLVWFSFEANIEVLDQLVAYSRPRVQLTAADWAESTLSNVYSRGVDDFQRRALVDSNDQIPVVLCDRTSDTIVTFSADFRFDQPGC